MRAKPLTVIVIGCALAGAAPAAVYDLDPAHTFVHFEVLHFGTSTMRGRIGPVRGTVEFDRGAHRGYVGLRVPLASVDTGVAPFDARLRRDDLLAADDQPHAYFVAADWRFEGERLHELRGELTWRGLSRPLALRALHFACRDDVRQRTEVCGGDFEAHLHRSEFGAGFGLPFIADRVRLVIQVEALRR